mmetsp:Transcript_9254/g.16675  ORF Transcript_9254/g.16675 Transcript_9254/m.16675 type:complete len:419 (+) Transcript_9254:114-1370(+)
MPPRKANAAVPLDWANQRLAKIEAAKQRREDLKDHLTEEHTFCPKRMARRAASNGRLPQGLPRLPAAPPPVDENTAAGGKQGLQKETAAKGPRSSATRTFSPVDDASRRKHSKPPTPRAAGDHQAAEEPPSAVKSLSPAQRVSSEPELGTRRKSASNAPMVQEAFQSFQASPRAVEGGASARRSPPQQALQRDRRPIDVEVAMDGPSNLVVSSTLVYEYEAKEVGSQQSPQQDGSVKDELPPPPPPPPAESSAPPATTAEQAGSVEQSLPADSKLWCMDLEATWQCGLEDFGADDADLMQNGGNAPQTQVEACDQKSLASVTDGCELPSPSDRSTSGPTMARLAGQAEQHTSSRLDEMSSDGAGSPSLAAHAAAVDSAQAGSEGGIEALPVDQGSTLFEGSSSRDSWSVVPMPAALVG